MFKTGRAFSLTEIEAARGGKEGAVQVRLKRWAEGCDSPAPYVTQLHGLSRRDGSSEEGRSGESVGSWNHFRRGKPVLMAPFPACLPD